MLTTRLARAATAFIAGLCCTVSWGCGGSQNEQKDDPAVKQAPPAAEAAAASTIEFQITGLVLMVPSNERGGQMHALLPKPRMMGAHVAYLGFTIPQGSTFDRAKLCDRGQLGQLALASGICYVNLKDWKLDAFGAQGQPALSQPPAPSESTGLLNLTRVSGGNHKAYLPQARNRSLAEIQFLSGQMGAQPCKLASWAVKPVNAAEQEQTEERAMLANVVSWVIRDPASRDLVFRKASETITVTLPQGSSKLLLAHIPKREEDDLPPNQASTPTPPNPRLVAGHFRVYYDLMTTAGGDTLRHDSKRRRLPHSPRDLELQACPVDLKFLGDTVAPVPPSIATYACMPAAAPGY